MDDSNLMNGKEIESENCGPKLHESIDKLKLADDPRAKLKRWLGKLLRITITDGRVIVGNFACTDRDGNTVLECSREYSNATDDNEPRYLHQALIPGNHIVSIELFIE